MIWQRSYLIDSNATLASTLVRTLPRTPLDAAGGCDPPMYKPLHLPYEKPNDSQTPSL